MKTPAMHPLFRSTLLGAAAACATGALGWGGPHGTITRAAAACLPEAQRAQFGPELQPLGFRYCIIPDSVYTDEENAPFAMMDAYPGVVYLKILHLPGAPRENYEVLRYFLGKSVAALQEGKPGDAARYAGTLAHALEDWGCPAHAVPNDNMFTLFQQFLPPPPDKTYTLLHSPVENGSFTLEPDGYRPSLLGTSVDEAAFNLLRRAQSATVRARGQVIPIIQAYYAGDTNAVNNAQQTAAAYDVKLVADALYTVCCLGQKHFEGAETLASVDLSQWSPLEAPDLYMPQSSFFSKPYWGYATAGTILRDGKPVPLQLNVTEQGKTAAKTFDAGIGTGTRSVLTYLIPAGVYTRFTAVAGLHAELGQTGHVTFEIKGNDKSLIRIGPLTGAAAQPIDVPLAGVTNLQLTVTSAGGDGSGNYAVWGAPCLRKE